MTPVEQTVNTFSQYGPMALITALLLLAGGYAARCIYLRMANALDRMQLELIKMSEAHAADIKLRDDRILQVVENNTNGFTKVAERLTAVETRLSDVETACEHRS